MVHARLTVLMMAACAATVSAQVQGQGARRQQRAAAADSLPRTRADLEQLVRQRVAQVTKQRLGATDEQMVRLQATNRKFDEKRRILVDQERDVRMALRDEMLRPDSARQGRVAELLDRVIKTQRQRVDIQEQEQQELAGFLTPLQRAKYFALEQQIRQRVTQLRQAQQGRGGRPGRVGLPGAGRGGRGVQPPPPPQ
jgi:periplasmic protein CpxP/Spy